MGSPTGSLERLVEKLATDRAGAASRPDPGWGQVTVFALVAVSFALFVTGLALGLLVGCFCSCRGRAEKHPVGWALPKGVPRTVRTPSTRALAGGILN